jgi:hypothetical protein
MNRVGRLGVYTPNMTIYLKNSLEEIMYIHRRYMVLANSTSKAYLIGRA